MVVVDRLIKYAHFCALYHPFKSITVATAFMEKIQKIHGNPKIIVSDRDSIFTGHFWMKLFSCLGTQLAHSSSYHPQYDGHTKIMICFWKDIFVGLYLIDKHNGPSGYL